MGLLQSLGLARMPGDVAGTYDAIVRQARRAYFFEGCGVPDTVGGRFDMLALHAYVVLRRLKEFDGAQYRKFAQALHDHMFNDLDRNLREMGVGDLAVGRQVKDLAKLFYGRIAAYDQALAGSPLESIDALDEALSRNAYADAAPDTAGRAKLANYLRGAVAQSRDWAGEDILAARIVFPALPA